MNNASKPNDAPFQVTVVSDRHILINSLRRTLSSLCIVEEAAGGTVAQVAEALKDRGVGHIVILDQNPWTSESIREIVESADCQVIAWLPSISPEVALTSLELGIRGVLGDRCTEQEILQCVTAVHSGGSWLPREISTVLLTRRACKLTPREAELVSRIVCGLRNKEIAWSLGITEGTVKVYLARIFTKLGVSDRFELALFALRSMGVLPAQSGLWEAPDSDRRVPIQKVPRSVYPMRPTAMSPVLARHVA